MAYRDQSGMPRGRLVFICTWLASVSVGENVRMEKAAFGRCASLCELNLSCEIPKTENIFFGCNKLKDAEGFVIVDGILFDYLGIKSEITVPVTLKIRESLKNLNKS